MAHMVEAGRAGRDRASESVLWRNASEVAQNPILFNQAHHLARRFVMSESVARVVAEHCYAQGVRR